MVIAKEVIACARLRLKDIGLRVSITVARLSPDDIAWRPNTASNSVGNLALHICGNLRQRLHVGLGGSEDIRDRDAEFSERGPWDVERLTQYVRATFAEADAVLAELPTSRLTETQPIRGKETTVIEILSRVTAHAAEHAGQIIFIAKLRMGSRFETLSIPKRSHERDP